MRSQTRQRGRVWLTRLLLAVYGSAGVLGYGLHALWHCDHSYEIATAEHCHGGDCDLHAAHAKDCCHPHLGCETGKRLAQLEEECSICAFLAQAQSEHAEELPVLCTASSPADRIASEFSALPPLVRLHLARGPPLA